MTHFAPLGAFRAADDLWTRLTRNFSRLEEDKYRPQHVFQRAKEHEKWPGDTEGRTLLAWILLAQATGREPRYLDAVLAAWPAEINAHGYFGKRYTEGISEQQLSSHGWVLRALAELERWRPGGPARALAAPILENLFLPTAGHYPAYPIDPAERVAAGAHSGHHQKQIGSWILSTDIGCFAIGMDGVIDAYDVFRDPRLVPLVDEMIERFLAIDLHAIQAQTHATLTACRGLLRWADLMNRPSLVDEVVARYRLYTDLAWTETFSNYNWFERPRWTEPCAIVDSLMVAMELWRRTGNTTYLEDAHLVWFNALGHAQRANGGFGCDTCPGADGSTDLVFSVYEAHWCCTMRGGEGLARMTQYQVARAGDRLVLPFLLSGDYAAPGASGPRLSISSGYPQSGDITLALSGDVASVRALRVFIPSWLELPAPADGARRDGPWLEIPVNGPGTFTLAGRLVTRVRPLLPATETFLAHADAPRTRLGASRQVALRGPVLLAGKPGETCACTVHIDALQPIHRAYLDQVVEQTRSGRRLVFDAISL